MNSGIEMIWLGAKLHELTGVEFSAYGTSKEDGGVALMEVPEGSAAAAAGFQRRDLIQGINGKAVRNIADLLQAYAEARDGNLTIKTVRNQQTIEIQIIGTHVLTVSSTDQVANPTKPVSGKISASKATKNDPIQVLIDGQINEGYGPIFSNGTTGGAYKLELSDSQSVSKISSWSYNHGGKRGTQILTVYGSNSEKDPGWKTSDRRKFTPIASADTKGLKHKDFTSVTVSASEGKTLGKFKWIIWKTVAINTQGENTAFQEFSVE